MTSEIPFQVDVFADSDTTTIRCKGALVGATASLFRRCLERLLCDRHLRVELDMSEVQGLDETAVSVIVAAHERFRARRASLHIGRSNAGLDRLLDALALRHLQRAYR